MRPGIADQQSCRPCRPWASPSTASPWCSRSGWPRTRRRWLNLADRTYECFCSRREIAEAASAPHGSVPRYPGTCRNLTEAQRIERRLSRQPALRLRADGGAADHPTTYCMGEITAEVDDVVLRRNDGVPAYNLAVVVDDAFSGIDQVVRGDDLLPAAPTQAFLAELLGHHSTDLCPRAAGGERRRPTAGEARRRRSRCPSWLPQAWNQALCSAVIAESLNLAAPGEQALLDAMLERFDPGRLPLGPWVVVPEKLTRAERLGLRFPREESAPPPAGVRFQGSKVRHVIIWADGTVTGLRGIVEGSRGADGGAA